MFDIIFYKKTRFKSVDNNNFEIIIGWIIQ